MSWLRLWTGLLVCGVAHAVKVAHTECHLPRELVKEIHGYQELVDKISLEATTGSYAGVFYNDLSNLTETFRSRKTGTESLNAAITNLSKSLSKKKLKSSLENQKIPAFYKNIDVAFFISNFKEGHVLIKAVQGSLVGVRTGPLMVVDSFDELEARREEVPGKIVLFNMIYTKRNISEYSTNKGSFLASQMKAAGVLVRSAVPFFLRKADDSSSNFHLFPTIPTALISGGDAEMLKDIYESSRLFIYRRPSAKDGHVSVKMIIKNKRDAKAKYSKNLIADFLGKSQPENYVTLIGRINTWDIGRKALGNGGGALLAAHSLLLLKHLNIEPPKRTLRAILWTGEQLAYYGDKAYAVLHRNETRNWTAALESNSGFYEPLGLKINGNTKAFCILKEIASMFKKIHATEIGRIGHDAEINVLKRLHVPLIQPLMKPNNDIWWRKTKDDTATFMDSTFMDRHLALFAGTAYILADLSKPLPKDKTKYLWHRRSEERHRENE